MTRQLSAVVFAVGSRLLKGDDLAFKVAKQLEHSKKARIVLCESLDSLISALAEAKEEQKFVLDVVKGLKEVQLLEIVDLKKKQVVGAHDFDAGFFLQIAEAAGWTKKLKIIGLPFGGKEKECKEAVKKIIGRGK